MEKKYLPIVLSFLIWGVTSLLSQSQDSEPLEYSLAVINAGKELARTDPSVKQFLDLLTNIEKKTSNSKLEISAYCIASHKIVKQNEVSKSLLQVTESISNLIPNNPILWDEDIDRWASIAIGRTIQSEDYEEILTELHAIVATQESR